MSRRRIGLGPRPGHDPDAEAWVRGSGRENGFTARMTIDVAPALRSRIKVIAFERGLTVAAMVRSLLEREYGSGESA